MVLRRQRAVFEDLLYRDHPPAGRAVVRADDAAFRCKSVPAPCRHGAPAQSGEPARRRPTTVKMWRLKRQGFSVSCCRTVRLLIPATALSVDQNGQLVTAGGFQVQPASPFRPTRVKHHDWPRRRGQRYQQGQAAPVQVGSLT